jgi:hypothetical protein
MSDESIEDTGRRTRQNATFQAWAGDSRRKAAEKRVQAIFDEHRGNLPIWCRAPQKGNEHFVGFSRAKLYELASKGLIRSKSLREHGRERGMRLFSLKSILLYVELHGEEVGEESTDSVEAEE